MGFFVDEICAYVFTNCLFSVMPFLMKFLHGDMEKMIRIICNVLN